MAKLAHLGRPLGTKGAPLGLAMRTPIGSPRNGARVFYQLRSRDLPPMFIVGRMWGLSVYSYDSGQRGTQQNPLCDQVVAQLAVFVFFTRYYRFKVTIPPWQTWFNLKLLPVTAPGFDNKNSYRRSAEVYLLSRGMHRWLC